jgi:hypothetical protein
MRCNYNNTIVRQVHIATNMSMLIDMFNLDYIINWYITINTDTQKH